LGAWRKDRFAGFLRFSHLPKIPPTGFRGKNATLQRVAPLKEKTTVRRISSDRRPSLRRAASRFVPIRRVPSNAANCCPNRADWRCTIRENSYSNLTFLRDETKLERTAEAFARFGPNAPRPGAGQRVAQRRGHPKCPGGTAPRTCSKPKQDQGR
jgi:hypothetical protein